MIWNRRSRLNALASIDLAPVRRLLIEKEGWTEERAKQVETEYRRFLGLIVLNPAETLVPTEEVDTFWHMHLLDTRKYERDCKAVFGKYLHHDPHLARGSAAHTRAFERTKALEKKTYPAGCSAAVIAACGASAGGRAHEEAGAGDGGDGGDGGGGSSCGSSGGSSCGGGGCGGGGCGGGS